jgi:hypothetical protein
MWPVLRAPVPADDARKLLRGSLAQRTGYDDTHPALADRLSALGIDAAEQERLAEEVSGGGDGSGVETAAEYYLGELRGKLSRRLDEEWCASVAPAWRERHEYVTKTRRKLAALDEKALKAELSDEEAWSRAEWTAEFKNVEEAVPLLRELTGRKKTAAAAHALLGQILLAKDDPSGVEHIEKAMAADREFIPVGCQVLYGYHHGQSRHEEAEAYRRRLLEHLNSAS